MKLNAFLATAVGAAMIGCTGNNPTAEHCLEELHEPCGEFYISKGVNLSHWLSQTPQMPDSVRQKIITKADFDSIKTMGFDFVRLPIEEQIMYAEDGRKNELGFALLDSALAWADANDLKLVCDLHILRSYHFNNGEYGKKNSLFEDEKEQDKLVEIWKDLQEHLMGWSTINVAYELLNEVAVDEPEKWNKLVARLIDTLRANETERMIIVGANGYQHPHQFKNLSVPCNDKNIMLSFHYYEPMPFTHYRAPWTDYAWYDGGVQYPGHVFLDTTKVAKAPESVAQYCRGMAAVWNKERMEMDIMEAVNVADSLGLRLFCGEFGCYPWYTNENDRVRYYTDIVDIFKDHNIAYCHWGYKGDFPIMDAETGKPTWVVKYLTK